MERAGLAAGRGEAGDERRPRTSRVGATSDTALVHAIAQGDRDAFALLYKRHRASAYRLAQRLTIDPRLAEHATQDAFLTIWRQADRFDCRRARVATWLLAITHHKAVDIVRAEQLRRTEPADRMGSIVDDSIDPPGETCLSERRGHVLSALSTLTAVQREVIELAYFEGQSQRQLAMRLDLPLGTIKSRTLAALRQLRSALESAGMTAEASLGG